MSSSTPSSDRKFLGWVIGAATLLSMAPFVIGWKLTPSGWGWFGNSALNAWDPGVYYSYIEQGRQGGVAMANLMTSEPFAATLVQPFWWLLGRVAEITGLSNPAVFHIARWLLVPAFVWSLWWAIRWIFADRIERRIALIVTLFGAGLGGWLSLLQRDFSFVLYADLWVSEALPVLTLWGSPHFLLVTAGIVVTLVGVERAWREQSWSWAVVAGAAALVTLVQHPFHIITWLTFWIALTAWRFFKQPRTAGRYALIWLTVIGIGAPALLLHGLQMMFDPLVSARAAQNINLTWPVTKTFAFLGVFGPLAALGWWRLSQRKNFLWVAGLAVVYVSVIYFPLDFQRRLSHGMFIPWAWLAAPALAWLWHRIKTRTWRWMAAALFMIFISGSWLRTGWEMIGGFAYEVAVEPVRGTYVSPDDLGLVAWLRSHRQPQNIVLSSYTTSRVLAGLGGQRVFIAHNVETINFKRKEYGLRSFYQSWLPAQQRNLMAREHICFVVDGWRERGYGEAFQADQLPELIEVWRGQDMALYQTPECR